MEVVVAPKGHFRRAAGIACMVSGCTSTPIHYAAGRAGWRTVPLPIVLPFRRASEKVLNRLIPCSKYGARISKRVAQALYQSHILRIWDVGRLDKRPEFGWKSLWGTHAVHGWILYHFCVSFLYFWNVWCTLCSGHGYNMGQKSSRYGILSSLMRYINLEPSFGQNKIPHEFL